MTIYESHLTLHDLSPVLILGFLFEDLQEGRQLELFVFLFDDFIFPYQSIHISLFPTHAIQIINLFIDLFFKFLMLLPIFDCFLIKILLF